MLDFYLWRRPSLLCGQLRAVWSKTLDTLSSYEMETMGQTAPKRKSVSEAGGSFFGPATGKLAVGSY